MTGRQLSFRFHHLTWSISKPTALRGGSHSLRIPGVRSAGSSCLLFLPDLCPLPSGTGRIHARLSANRVQSNLPKHWERFSLPACLEPFWGPCEPSSDTPFSTSEHA